MIETITCPQCGHELSIDNALTLKLEKKFADDLKQKTLDLEKAFKEREIKILSDESVNLKEKILLEFKDQIEMLSKEATESKNQLIEHKKTLIENEQLKRNLDQQRQDLELEFEKKFNEQLKNSTTDISKREAEKHSTKITEYQIVIDSLKKQIEEMRVKASEGSNRLQGESLEISIEEEVANVCPNDIVVPVAKGVKGADLEITILNKAIECGKILVECKKTKNLNSLSDWILKLKSDASVANSDVLIIVFESTVERKDLDGIFIQDGVFVCTDRAYLRYLILIIREYLIRLNSVTKAQENTTEKAQLLLQYLQSKDFQFQISNIVRGFNNLQQSYHREKSQMEKLWRARQKELETILTSTNIFLGTLEGISSNIKIEEPLLLS